MQKCFNWLDLPDHARPFGGQIVIDSLIKNGHIVKDYDGSDKKNILVSLYWCEDIYDLIRFRARNGIKDGSQIIAGGNYAGTSPNAVLPFVGGCFAGDGDNWDGISLENIATSGKTIKLKNDSFECKKIKMETKSVGKNEADIMEISRGCKHKCLFCQYSWLKPYKEHSFGDIQKELESKTTKRIRMTCADLFQHSEYNKILDETRRRGIYIANQDAALNSIKHLTKENIEKSQRFGIDGMSERLRLMVNKNITNDFLIECLVKYRSLGVGRCLGYNIFGYPTESKGDFEDWIKTLNRVIDNIEPPFTFVISWNAFMPMPLTPLQWSATSYKKDIRDLKVMNDVRERAKKKGINILDMPQTTGGTIICKRALAIRGSEKSAKLIYNVALKNMDDKQICKAFKELEGYDLNAEYDTDKELPWDKYIDYNKEQLKKIYMSKVKKQC